MIDASVINARLLNNYPGYLEMMQGIEAFEKQHFYTARKLFISAIRKAYKIKFDGHIFMNREEIELDDVWNYVVLHELPNGEVVEECEFSPEDCGYYYLMDIKSEINCAIRRNCNLYLGLISLNLLEFEKAHTYFSRSIGFGIEQKDMGDWFFYIINVVNPYWIYLVSQTSLYLDDQEAAYNHAKDYAEETWRFLNRWIDDGWEYGYDEFVEKKQLDSKKNWLYLQRIHCYNNLSIVLKNDNKIEDAIKCITDAIDWYNLCEDQENFISNSTLYSNRGLFYCEINDYVNALNDFNLAVHIESGHPDNYINRAFVYLFLGKYSEAIKDYSTAIELDSYNSDYYRLRALAYYLDFSREECKHDKMKAKLIDQAFDEEEDSSDSKREIEPNDWLCAMPIKDGSVILSGKNDDLFYFRLTSKTYFQVLQSFLPFLEMRGR